MLRESHLLVLASRAFDRIFRRSSAERFGDESFQHIFGIYTPEFLDREALFLRLVEGMKRMCEARGARFHVALLPINFMVEPEKIDKVVPGSRFRGREAVYYGRLQPLLERRGIVAVNVEAEMKRAGEGP